MCLALIAGKGWRRAVNRWKIFSRIQDWQMIVIARAGMYIIPIILDGCRGKRKFLRWRVKSWNWGKMFRTQNHRDAVYIRLMSGNFKRSVRCQTGGMAHLEFGAASAKIPCKRRMCKERRQGDQYRHRRHIYPQCPGWAITGWHGLSTMGSDHIQNGWWADGNHRHQYWI